MTLYTGSKNMLSYILKKEDVSIFYEQKTKIYICYYATIYADVFLSTNFMSSITSQMSDIYVDRVYVNTSSSDSISDISN